MQALFPLRRVGLALTCLMEERAPIGSDPGTGPHVPTSHSPRGGPNVRRMTMAWTTRMCMVAVSPLVQRRKTWSWDSDCRRRGRVAGLRHGAPDRGGARPGSSRGPYPAVHLLPLLALAHALHVAGEDGEQGDEHRVRLRAAGALREQVGHDGGALHDQPGHVLGAAARPSEGLPRRPSSPHQATGSGGLPRPGSPRPSCMQWAGTRATRADSGRGVRVWAAVPTQPSARNPDLERSPPPRTSS